MLRKSKTKFITIFLLLILVYSLLYSLVYNYFVIGEIDEFKLKFKNVCGQLIIELPCNDAYLIKIWGFYYPKRVYFNETEIVPFATRERGGLKELFFKVDNTLVNRGVNVLNIISNESYSVKVKNFYGATESGSIFVLFDTSRFLKDKPEKLIPIFCITFLVVISVIAIFYFIIKFILLRFKFTKFFLIYCISNFILILLFLTSTFLLLLTPYRIIFSKQCFISLSLFILFIYNFILFCVFARVHSKHLILNFNIPRAILYLLKLPLNESRGLSLDFLYAKFKFYFKKNPEQYLIATFILSLFACMFLLTFRLYAIANWLSYFAYICLALGLGIRFVKLIKENR